MDKWIICKGCGHKLLKLVNCVNGVEIEIKCKSCKTINDIKIPKKKEKK